MRSRLSRPRVGPGSGSAFGAKPEGRRLEVFALLPLPRISVAMCTFNGERYLRAQLSSIAAGTLLPAELVITDDGSTDATEAIVAAFAAESPFPVRFERNAVQLGSTKNFARAMGLCTGELIALADQDDLWLPEKLERVAGMFARDPATTCVFTNAALMDEAGDPLPSDAWTRFLFTPARRAHMASGEAAAALLQVPVVTGATMVFRAALRDAALPIPETWVHDGWLAWVAALTGNLQPLDECLIRYRLHGTQQLGLARESGWQRLRRMGLRAALRAEKARTVRFYEHMARNYAALAHAAEQRHLGTPAQQAALRDKVQFAHRALAALRAPRFLRLVPSLRLLEGYGRFAPHGRQTVLRHALL